VLDFLHSPEFQASLATIVLGLTALLAFTLTGSVLQFISAHVTKSQFIYLQNIASVAVQAAEGAGLDGQLSDKKASAIKIVDAYLKGAGVTGFTAGQIDAAIEAAVLDQFNRFKAEASSWPAETPTETTAPAA